MRSIRSEYQQMALLYDRILSHRKIIVNKSERLLTQSNTAIPNNIRRQAKMLYIWYPKNRTDLNTIHEENDVIGPEELARVKAQLKWGKHTCLIMRMEHPRAYMIC